MKKSRAHATALFFDPSSGKRGEWFALIRLPRLACSMERQETASRAHAEKRVSALSRGGKTGRPQRFFARWIRKCESQEEVHSIPCEPRFMGKTGLRHCRDSTFLAEALPPGVKERRFAPDGFNGLRASSPTLLCPADCASLRAPARRRAFRSTIRLRAAESSGCGQEKSGILQE